VRTDRENGGREGKARWTGVKDWYLYADLPLMPRGTWSSADDEFLDRGWVVRAKRESEISGYQAVDF
jgi:hypothetical protein